LGIKMKLVILNLTNQIVHYVSHPLSEVFYLPRPRGKREIAFSPPRCPEMRLFSTEMHGLEFTVGEY